MRVSKRMKVQEGLVDKSKSYSIKEAVEILKKAGSVKFDASVDIQMKLGADPDAANQSVRGTTILPHGTGKNIRVVVLTKDEAGKDALEAGAESVGGAELVEKISKGWMDFDAVVASPSIMRDVGRLGKILGPRGLMPSPKAGTVTDNVAQAVRELKGGRIEFKMDKQSNLNCGIGRVSFDLDKLVQNCEAFLNAVVKARPKDIKGEYVLSVHLSSTMGPGVRLSDSEYKIQESE